MIRNYFKIAWRNLVKNRGIFSINIAGLAIGIASCLIIMLFVIDELSYDRYNQKADEIVRVVFNAKINGEQIKEAVVMAPVATTLVREFPEVLDATRIRNIGTPKITYNNKSYRNDKFAYVDHNFFDVFSLSIIRGDHLSPLKEPNTIVLTQAEAIKYFGDEDPIGKLLIIEDQDEPFRVTAIIDKIPANSHFHFDMLASMDGYKDAESTSWMGSSFYSYLLLKKGTDYKKLEAKLPTVFEKYAGPQIKQALGMSFSEFTKTNKLGLFLQPLTDIHLNSDFSSASTLEQGGDMKTIYIFIAVSIFMLLIACVNFMNLATASATSRAKEVGIKKVLGSEKKQLIYQFLMESFIAVLLAMTLALILVAFTLPFFNNLSNKTLQISYLLNIKALLSLTVFSIVISLLAGAYPAFYIAAFNPISALKSKFSDSGKNKGLRSGLVVFQFAVSAVLIFTTLIVTQQMDFIQTKDLGYDKKQVLVLRESYFLGNNETAFKNKIVNDPIVENVTNSGYVPVGASNTEMSGIIINQEFYRRVYVYNIDNQYIPTLGMKLVEGRNFSEDFGADSSNVIINETASKLLGFEDHPIGKTLTRAINNEGGRQILNVIGVVKDFHFRSLHQKIDPLIMLNNPNGGLIIRAKVSDMSEIIKSISKLWSSFNVGEPFNYTLLDDSYNMTYLAEKRMEIILKIFALLTIFIACLGLFGLVTFTVERRFKEIGVRKVLGSSVSQVVMLLSKDFIKLIFVSFLIAFPLGFYLMNNWLQDFAYRIGIQWPVFIISGMITLIIAFITISFQAIKAAIANPVKSLRTE